MDSLNHGFIRPSIHKTLNSEILTLLATLALSNVEKPDQNIIEQDITLFLTIHFSKLWESLEEWSQK